MCGVAGVVSFDDQRFVERDPGLGHRGPDACGEIRLQLLGGGVAHLFHTRLAIQDLSDAGVQPVTSQDGRFTLVYGGEIYNYPSLRRECEALGDIFRSDMDGEVILHLWRRYGAEALNRLNGMYALALADNQSGAVVLARDPMGVKPLFTVQDGSNLWFASELAALRRLGAPLGASNITGLAQFLTFLWIPDPNTPHSAAQSVPAGTTVTWQHGQCARGVISYRSTDSAPTPDLLGMVDSKVQASARRQLLADVPVALMASGGVDSSLLWWAAGDGIEQAYTISWAPEGGPEGLSEDTTAVRQLEARLGTPVRYLSGEDAERVVLPSSGDLIADPAFELTRQIARATREDGYKVLWSGQGGDELFAGYRRHFVAGVIDEWRLGRRSARALERLCSRYAGESLTMEYAARLSRAFAEPDSFSAYMQLCSYSTPRERAEALDCTEVEVSDEVVWAQHRAVFDAQPLEASFLRKVLAVDQSVYLPGLGLAYVDRASMEFSVEVRVPWLDLELVHWARTLPDHELVRRGRGKRLPRALAARELGPQLANRPKRGFAAPTRLVKRGPHQSGQRGHRQGAYFARARQILDAHLAS